MGGLGSRSDMAVDHHLRVRQRLPHRFPIVVVQAVQADQRRVVREADGMDPQNRHPPDLSQRLGHVPQGQDDHGNEAPWRAGAPVEHMPVIIGPDGGQGDRPIRCFQKDAAGESREGREVDRRQHAIDVHVVDAGLGVVGPFAHLGIGARLHAIFAARTADHGIEADRGIALAFPYPAILAVHHLDARRTILQPLREVAKEGVGRLDHMVVHADQDHIVQAKIGHWRSPCLAGPIGSGL